MKQLKPCPFCGGEAKFFTKTYSSKGTHKCWDFGIYCSLCNLVSPRTDYHLEIDFGSDGDIEIIQDDRSLAASMWNVRSNE
jgi:hypothetical protein